MNIQPLSSAFYWASRKDLEIEKTDIDQFLYKNIIKTSLSLWASPLLSARKEDGSIWFCTLYQVLSTMIFKYAYPTLNIADSTDSLRETWTFLTLNANSNYLYTQIDKFELDTIYPTLHDRIDRLVRILLGAKNPKNIMRWVIEIVVPTGRRTWFSLFGLHR